MNKFYRDAIDAAKDEAAKFNMQICFEHLTKHSAVTIKCGQQTHKIILSGTPRSRDNQAHWMR